MYIAFKWLVSLAIVMWLAMCFTNIYLKQDKNISDPGIYLKESGFTFKNTSKIRKESKLATKEYIHNPYNKEESMVTLHLIMFIAGALAVSALNRKQEILGFIEITVSKMSISAKKLHYYFKYPSIRFGVATMKYLQTFWEEFKSYRLKILHNLIVLNKTTEVLRQRYFYNGMLDKLKVIGEERKNLGQLLMSAIQENKHIRMQYQLELLAKNRLSQYIEKTNKQIKDNRSRYASFQHLYLVTHQENSFLKACIRKLTKEKEEAENKLIGLINEVYKTKNTELKSYCCRHIIQTKDSLLNCDVCAEIHKFLCKTSKKHNSASSWNLDKSKVDITILRSWPLSAGTRISEILQDSSVVPLVSDTPKLKGLPGEYVWTVKDKDGIIEKLYEYDYDSDFDSGDTIRKIRQYSVYYDRDCLLDFSNSLPDYETHSNMTDYCHRANLNVESPRFVSGSKAFQNFLRKNNSIMVPISSKHQ